VLDPLETLTFVAAHTRRIALGTGVLNLPWYNPVLLARRLTTLDILSAGRLRVGFGIGWSPDEYEAAGVTWHERGKRADELIKALKKIWTTDPVDFQGKYYRIPKSVIGPKPVQKPHPPIYMAAFTPSALKRVATEANGWFPVGIPLSGVGPMFEGIKGMAKDAGRDPSALELIVRANVEIHNAPILKDRVDFTGTLEQIAEDVTTARKLSAAEIVI
jgi:probable F420-dependent oxidoreductase